jgi:HD-GYP domain-containing protein (c-di-GMP phosphodiesterase class II)
MNARAKWYVTAVVVGAVLASLAVYWSEPAPLASSLSAVILLSTLALVAEALAVLHPNSVHGSMGFVPYLAAALIAPNWYALVGAVAVKAIVEVMTKRAPATGLFNICQQAVTFSSAVLAFRLAGGESMINVAHLPLARITLENGLPSLASFVFSFVVNSTLVLGFIGAKSNRGLGELWRATQLSTIGLDVLASPIVFLFAWVYVSFGPYAAAAIWVPVLGLRQLHKNSLDLERTNSELLELMVKSMEARDPYTSGHSRRVQHFSLNIARALGLPLGEIDRVGRASLLHDVGKIHEKYAPILRKPGKLSPEEWQTMQEHPADGAALVSTMSRLHDIVPSIRHHHERWDGTGYPEGLAGETIPLGSRIIAFADTIDAMTSERPYRRPLSEEEVRVEILCCRGTQFDPVITDKVLSAQVWRQFFVPTPVNTPAVKSGLSLMPPARPEAVKQA